ncbi:hypothetical protein HW555_000954 [Spodoptera exigua]|uniref:Peptidase A2 domain-containing protein n=1 Tax=Spodoptera exigua TaxID=7107 RepID=A0A835LFX3_SPOEX|nr:hypothetical protein HW555_000954 [Spodoptera exigua]
MNAVTGRSISFNLFANIQLEEFIFGSHRQLQELITCEISYGYRAAGENNTEPHSKDDKLPTWDDLKQFLQSRYRTLELVMSTSGIREKPVKERSHLVTATATTSPSSEHRKCVLCKENHTLCHCKDFTKLQPVERSEYVKSNKLCFNCLAPGHSAYQCKLRMNCRICSRRHHTLLHRSKDSASSVQSEDSKQPKAIQHGVEEKEEIVNTTIASHHSAKQSTSLALLATATVSARNEHNHTVVLRALIDQGSQASFISEKATQLLKLSRHTARGSIIGVGSTRTNVDHVVQLRIGSRWNPSFEINIQAYVMSKQLTTKIPSTAVPVTHWPHLEGLNLADPDYHKPGPIDLLLGVKEYAQLVQQQLIKGPPGSPCAQKTNLGWILFGEINTSLQEDSFLMDLEEGLTSQFKEFANLRELIQVITYCRRFLNFKRSLENTDKDFTTKELEKSLMKCIELAWFSSISLSPRGVGRTEMVARSRSASRSVARSSGSRANCTPHMYTARRTTSAADPIDPVYTHIHHYYCTPHMYTARRTTSAADPIDPVYTHIHHYYCTPHMYTARRTTSAADPIDPVYTHIHHYYCTPHMYTARRTTSAADPIDPVYTHIHHYYCTPHMYTARRTTSAADPIDPVYTHIHHYYCTPHMYTARRTTSAADPIDPVYTHIHHYYCTPHMYTARRTTSAADPIDPVYTHIHHYYCTPHMYTARRTTSAADPIDPVYTHIHHYYCTPHMYTARRTTSAADPIDPVYTHIHHYYCTPHMYTARRTTSAADPIDPVYTHIHHYYCTPHMYTARRTTSAADPIDPVYTHIHHYYCTPHMYTARRTTSAADPIDPVYTHIHIHAAHHRAPHHLRRRLLHAAHTHIHHYYCTPHMYTARRTTSAADPIDPVYTHIHHYYCTPHMYTARRTTSAADPIDPVYTHIHHYYCTPHMYTARRTTSAADPIDPVYTHIHHYYCTPHMYTARRTTSAADPIDPVYTHIHHYYCTPHMYTARRTTSAADPIDPVYTHIHHYYCTPHMYTARRTTSAADPIDPVYTHIHHYYCTPHMYTARRTTSAADPIDPVYTHIHHYYCTPHMYTARRTTSAADPIDPVYTHIHHYYCTPHMYTARRTTSAADPIDPVYTHIHHYYCTPHMYTAPTYQTHPYTNTTYHTITIYGTLLCRGDPERRPLAVARVVVPPRVAGSCRARSPRTAPAIDQTSSPEALQIYK